jgi:hypothetical protein
VTASPLEVALIVAAAMEGCGVRYVVGGSLASSLSGEPRTTLDVDIVVALDDSQVDCVTRALKGDFYADVDAIRRAVRAHASVNVIHHATGTKVDLFVAGGGPLDWLQLERRRLVHPPGLQGALYVQTPEDILLQKLRWYRLGGQTSDRQWRDVLGLLLVQAGSLDAHYLHTHAVEAGVADLLSLAIEQVERG